MTRLILSLSALGALGAAATATLAGPRTDRAPVIVGEVQPVVIELFQSQGCSSCPPALAVLDLEANRRDIIALNFAVTYWDQLGWKDTHARPQFTSRQWDYARSGGRSNVSTPQLMVAGRQAIVGSRKSEVDAVIAAHAGRIGPIIKARDNRVAIGAGKSGRPATIWLVDYDPRSVPVSIRAGENGGRTLPHRNIVKRLSNIGQWNGTLAVYPIPGATPGLARAVIVQAGTGGPIVAGRKI